MLPDTVCLLEVNNLASENRGQILIIDGFTESLDANRLTNGAYVEK